jgi:hypothetical protein
LAFSLTLSDGPVSTENRLACFTLIPAFAVTVTDVAQASENDQPISLFALPGIRALNE